jgi:cytochrome c553
MERALFIEAGYRCAIPTCRVIGPLEIEHIEDWAKVKEHKFANMIVLCANCHGLKGEGPRKLDRKALRQIKANLGIINGRYGETERRVLAFLIKSPRLCNGDTLTIKLPGGFEILIHYLLEDGILAPLPHKAVVKKSMGLAALDAGVSADAMARDKLMSSLDQDLATQPSCQGCHSATGSSPASPAVQSAARCADASFGNIPSDTAGNVLPFCVTEPKSL